METKRNRIINEASIYRQSVNDLTDVMVTDDEMNFLVKLFEAVDDIVKNKNKVSLPRLSTYVKVPPIELYDYIDTIIKFEARSKHRYEYSK